MNDTTFQGNGKIIYVPVVVNAKPPKQTNSDRIRAMTDEELAEWFHRIQYDVSDYYCGGHSCEPTLPTGKESWLGWLKQEASDGED